MYTFTVKGDRLWNLSRSVGWGYGYLIWDAKLVQYLLNVGNITDPYAPGQKPLTIDGKVGARTDAAIRAYTRHNTGRSSGVASRAPEDGRIILYAFGQLMLEFRDACESGGLKIQFTDNSMGWHRFLHVLPLPAKFPAMPSDLRGYLKSRWDSSA